MGVTTETLRDTFSRKSSGDLQQIVEAAEGQYTPEAVAVAREILSGRPMEAEQAVEQESVAQSSKSNTGGGLVAVLGASFVLKQVFYAWRSAENNPKAMSEAFHLVVTSPWTYAFILSWVVWLWRKRRAA